MRLCACLSKRVTAQQLLQPLRKPPVFSWWIPDLLATDVVLTDGSSTSLVKQAQTAGAKTLMMTGSPDRIVEFDGSGQPYLSKPFPPEAFLQRVDKILSTS